VRRSSIPDWWATWSSDWEIEDRYLRHPEIDEVPIVAPLFG
jgi:hypothetical protein